MASVLDQYGIKEVADVTMYKIVKGEDNLITYEPVLFLDTLKISTVETTAEQTEARGGKGNSPLIIWDYGKEITVTLQDALFSPASMALMFGDQNGLDEVTEMKRMRRMTLTTALTTIPTGKKYYVAGTNGMVEATTAQLSANTEVFEEATISGISGKKIEVNASTFPGTYRLVGETYARDKVTGEDKFFQFIIPQAKMSSTNTLTLEAEGDPSVFDMEMRVLRPTDGKMMELIQYDIGPNDEEVTTLASFSTYSTSTSSLSGK